MLRRLRVRVLRIRIRILNWRINRHVLIASRLDNREYRLRKRMECLED
jgi:hypothetical protein